MPASNDPRVRVLRNPENRGVGGAIVTAYKAAVEDGMDIVVKIDGDGLALRRQAHVDGDGHWNAARASAAWPTGRMTASE